MSWLPKGVKKRTSCRKTGRASKKSTLLLEASDVKLDPQLNFGSV